MERLYRMFLAVDATQVEINPLGETPSGEGKCPLFIKAGDESLENVELEERT